MVGTSLTTAGFDHAFAYDLATGVMRDLGDLGGTSSYATDVDAGVVVGRSFTADPTSGNHTFVVDLHSAVPVMRDLGPRLPRRGAPGGRGRQLSNGRGPVARVGLRPGRARPRPQGLGNPGRGDLNATDVDAGVVVGSAQTAGHANRAFAYDLRAARPRMRDLGAPIGGTSTAYSISGRYIVGVAYRAGDHQRRGFAYDLDGTQADGRPGPGRKQRQPRPRRSTAPSPSARPTSPSPAAGSTSSVTAGRPRGPSARRRLLLSRSAPRSTPPASARPG